MDLVLVDVTVDSMDAGVELPGMDLQRVTASNARFMSLESEISLQAVPIKAYTRK
jgi:hypothetical protein